MAMRTLGLIASLVLLVAVLVGRSSPPPAPKADQADVEGRYGIPGSISISDGSVEIRLRAMGGPSAGTEGREPAARSPGRGPRGGIGRRSDGLALLEAVGERRPARVLARHCLALPIASSRPPCPDGAHRRCRGRRTGRRGGRPGRHPSVRLRSRDRASATPSPGVYEREAARRHRASRRARSYPAGVRVLMGQRAGEVRSTGRAAIDVLRVAGEPSWASPSRLASPPVYRGYLAIRSTNGGGGDERRTPGVSAPGVRICTRMLPAEGSGRHQQDRGNHSIFPDQARLRRALAAASPTTPATPHSTIDEGSGTTAG